MGTWVLKELSLGPYVLFKVVGLSVRASGLVVLEKVQANFKMLDFDFEKGPAQRPIKTKIEKIKISNKKTK